MYLLAGVSKESENASVAQTRGGEFGLTLHPVAVEWDAWPTFPTQPLKLRDRNNSQKSAPMSDVLAATPGRSCL